jgi:hypothetical protein
MSKSAEKFSKFGANTPTRIHKEETILNLSSSELINELGALRRIISDFGTSLKNLEFSYFSIEGKSAFDPC